MSAENCIFPREIIEIILSYCDGKTLICVKFAQPHWKEIIHYLTQKQNIWHRCCENDIPRQQLLQYKNKCTFTTQTQWENLYCNWLCWNDIKTNVVFECNKFNISRECLLGHMKCIATFGGYIGVGNQNGTVMIFNQSGILIKEYKHEQIISSIYFVHDNADQPVGILVATQNSISLRNLHKCHHFSILQYHRALSVYRNIFCGITSNGLLNIIRVISDTTNQHLSYEITHTLDIYAIRRDSIHSRQFQASNMISESQIVFLLDTKVILLTINEDIYSITERGTLQLARGDISLWVHNVWLLTNEVILISSKELDRQDLELFIFSNNIGNDENPKKKVFWPQTTFGAPITCITLYGNTLLLGTFDSFIYFYEIQDWNRFDIERYSKSIEVGVAFGPIKTIDVVEREGERSFYCTSAWEGICRITGKCILH